MREKNNRAGKLAYTIIEYYCNMDAHLPTLAFHLHIERLCNCILQSKWFPSRMKWNMLFKVDVIVFEDELDCCQVGVCIECKKIFWAL